MFDPYFDDGDLGKRKGQDQMSETPKLIDDLKDFPVEDPTDDRSADDADDWEDDNDDWPDEDDDDDEDEDITD